MTQPLPAQNQQPEPLKPTFLGFETERVQQGPCYRACQTWNFLIMFPFLLLTLIPSGMLFGAFEAPRHPLAIRVQHRLGGESNFTADAAIFSHRDGRGIYARVCLKTAQRRVPFTCSRDCHSHMTISRFAAVQSRDEATPQDDSQAKHPRDCPCGVADYSWGFCDIVNDTDSLIGCEGLKFKGRLMRDLGIALAAISLAMAIVVPCFLWWSCFRCGGHYEDRQHPNKVYRVIRNRCVSLYAGIPFLILYVILAALIFAESNSFITCEDCCDINSRLNKAQFNNITSPLASVGFENQELLTINAAAICMFIVAGIPLLFAVAANVYMSFARTQQKIAGTCWTCCLGADDDPEEWCDLVDGSCGCISDDPAPGPRGFVTEYNRSVMRDQQQQQAQMQQQQQPPVVFQGQLVQDVYPPQFPPQYEEHGNGGGVEMMQQPPPFGYNNNHRTNNSDEYPGAQFRPPMN